MIELPLIPLFERWAQERPEQIVALPESGSYRRYYRITSATRSAIGAINTDRKENLAFLEFSRHFKRHGLAVPEIYAEDAEHDAYLLQDLGDETLFSRLTRLREHGEFPIGIIPIYKAILDELPRFQIVAGRDLNYSVCYPRAAFDRQSILWDANYFKYYVLKFAKIPFDEQALEDDFQTFASFLLHAENHFFLYRDFQSRNIMLVGDTPYFIDYQGGRRGALQYDAASLLFDAKAEIPRAIRDDLFEYYMNAVSRYLTFDRAEFVEHYHGYVLIRMMQALGTYGFRGLFEQKAHFIQLIPLRLKALREFLEAVALPVKLPTLMAALRDLTESETLFALAAPPLTVSVFSFSYKRSLPVDVSGNGGGFVFDCRALPNPGRYPEYQQLTGKDDAVVRFLQETPEVDDFLAHVFALIDGAVNTYQRRHFAHLMVSFGCTGGRHRSVYCAERLAEHLRGRGVTIALRHIEQEH